MPESLKIKYYQDGILEPLFNTVRLLIQSSPQQFITFDQLSREPHPLLTTLGQPREASCPLDKVVLAGGEVMVDAVDKAGMTLAPANQRKKRLMPALTLKPGGMIPVSIITSAQPRKPSIGNS
jgi:hypothetical protein